MTYRNQMKSFLCLMVTVGILMGSVACMHPAVDPSTGDTDVADTGFESITYDHETVSDPTEITTDHETETTEPETEEPWPDVESPAFEDIGLAELLPGENQQIILDYRFNEYTYADLLSNEALVFTTLKGATSSMDETGIVSADDMWNCVGFNEQLLRPYKAETTICNRTGTEPSHTIMVGARVIGSTNLYINSGVWFAFAGNSVHVIVNDMSSGAKERLTKVVGSNFSFDAEKGVRVEMIDDGTTITVKADGTTVATVEFHEADDRLRVLTVDGTEVVTANLELFAHGDSLGYFRVMSHYCDSSIVSMYLEDSGTVLPYEPKDTLTELREGYRYFLQDKKQFQTNAPIHFEDDSIWVDAKAVAAMIGFEYEENGDTVALAYDDLRLTFHVGTAGMDLNGHYYAFPTVVKQGDTILLAADFILRWMGYTVKNTKGGAYIYAGKNALTKERINQMDELYELYQTVVYNYEDVACDQTGVGLFEPTPYDERLVGIAYSTWHRPSRDWVNGTWDVPLTGEYVSNDPDVLRRHAIQLRDAGVDFVFVDWSNNTDYDPETMGTSREDFRMIETATDLMFEIWSQIEGAPKICIFVGPGHNGIDSVDNGNHQKKVDQVYRDYVEKYADQYFFYEGKPLLICYGATPNQYGARPRWTDDRFTVRWMTGYVGQQSSLFDADTMQSRGFWSWEERQTQTYTVLNERVECMTVSAATRGRNPAEEGTGVPASYRNDGATFKKQFQRAMDMGAGMVLLTTWNEWSKTEQHSPEDSRDLEPSRIYGTFYYDLMRELIKKYKGQLSES